MWFWIFMGFAVLLLAGGVILLHICDFERERLAAFGVILAAAAFLYILFVGMLGLVFYREVPTISEQDKLCFNHTAIRDIIKEYRYIEVKDLTKFLHFYKPIEEFNEKLERAKERNAGFWDGVIPDEVMGIKKIDMNSRFCN